MAAGSATNLLYTNLRVAAEAIYDAQAVPAESTAQVNISGTVLTGGYAPNGKFATAKSLEFIQYWVVVENLSSAMTIVMGTLFRGPRN